MPVNPLHAQVAKIALEAAAEHGFALGGGNALIMHGVISRATEDVDLFTDREHGVEAATSGVEAALRHAGFEPDRADKTAGLTDLWEEMGEGLAEWAITAPDGQKMALQMAYFDRAREPVVMEFGPVLDLEDVAGGKTAAIASRFQERDYSDTAAMLRHYTPGQLISFAHRIDPGLEGRDYADAGQRLDRITDETFANLGLSQQEITELRERFGEWPRDPETAEEMLTEAKREQQQQQGREPGQAASEPVRGAAVDQHANRADELTAEQGSPSPQPRAADELRQLTTELGRADNTLRRIEARQAERAAEQAADDSQRHIQAQAAEQQRGEELSSDAGIDPGPEVTIKKEP